MSQRIQRNRRRRGAAVAELAICLPAIVLLIMGTIECCSMIYLRQSLHIAAYEAIRVAINDDGTGAQAESRARQIISERAIEGAVIRLTPATPEFEARGTPISVQVTAPGQNNNVLPLRFFNGDISASALMIKE